MLASNKFMLNVVKRLLLFSAFHFEEMLVLNYCKPIISFSFYKCNIVVC